MKTALLILSVAINIVFAVSYYGSDRKELTPKSEAKPAALPVQARHFEITTRQNFEAVYFNSNDSIYKRCWNEAFENHPESAFLIACSYFYVTGNKWILDDIKVSAGQLEHAYQRKFPGDRSLMLRRQ